MCGIVTSDEHQVCSANLNSAQVQLQQWVVNYQISHTSFSSLLAILRQNYDN